MCLEETKEKKDVAGCCGPEKFKSMFEIIGKCYTGRCGFDCSSMMDVMKSQARCGLKTEKEENSGSCRPT